MLRTLSAAFRAFNPWPMSHFEAAENSIKVWQSRVSRAKHSDKPAGTIIQADKTGIHIATGQRNSSTRATAGAWQESNAGSRYLELSSKLV